MRKIYFPDRYIIPVADSNKVYNKETSHISSVCFTSDESDGDIASLDEAEDFKKTESFLWIRHWFAEVDFDHGEIK